MAAESDIVVVVHPPERGRVASLPAQAGPGCCCCCCCCLHSLGAIIGAATAPSFGRGSSRPFLTLTDYWDEEGHREALSARDREGIRAGTAPEHGLPAESFRAFEGDPDIALAPLGLSAVKVFWWVVLALVVVGLFLGVLSARGENSAVASGVMMAGLIILMVFPAIQLAAALIALFIVGVSPRPDKSFQLRQLAKIVLGFVLGTLAGLVAMVGIYFGAAVTGALGFVLCTIVSVVLLVALPFLLKSIR